MNKTLEKRKEKQKDVGMKWTTVRLGEVFSQIKNGASIKQTDGLSGIPITRIESISNSILDLDKLGYADIIDDSYSEFYLENGDILMSHINSWAHLGKNVIIENVDRKIIHGMNLLLLKAKRDLLFPKYSKYFFDSDLFRSQLDKISNQSVNQSSFSVTKLRDLQIPLPPLPIQKRIAEILDAADALRKKDQELLKKYDELAQAIFIELFGDPVKNEKGWEVKKIGQIVKSEDHLRVPIESAVRSTRQGQYPYYGASGIIDCFDDYIFNGTRLLIGEDGANLLARSTPIAFLAHGKYWVNNHAHVLNSDNLSLLTYLEFWFNSISLKPYITGSAQPKLNGSKLMEIEVPMPDKESLQSFDLAIKSILIQKNKVCPSDHLFQGILKNAFSGKLVS